MKLVDAKPNHGNLGIDEGRLIAPGSPERSVLWKRISTRGRGQMPPLASSLVDPEGAALLAVR
jgi:hypothetical protein